MGARNSAENLILFNLNVFDVCRREIWRVEAGGVVNLRASKDFECHQQVFRAVTPVSAGEGLNDLEIGLELLDDHVAGAAVAPRKSSALLRCGASAPVVAAVVVVVVAGAAVDASSSAAAAAAAALPR